MSERISLGRAEEDFFLGVYRAAVEYYQPRIEEKTGITLGDIQVFDYSCLADEYIKQRSNSIFSRIVRSLISRPVPKEAVERIRACCMEKSKKCIATYRSNGIYVSFGSEVHHEENIATTVVHELAHALWEKLAPRPLTWNPPKPEQEKYQEFVEGFAVYAERIWFLDIYPADVRRSVRSLPNYSDTVYRNGLATIKQVVAKNGQQVLPQIPARWREL
jgi:hypothetical protein